MKSKILLDLNNCLNVLFFRTDGNLEKARTQLSKFLQEYHIKGEVILCVDTIFHDNFRNKIKENYKKRKHKSPERKEFLRTLLWDLVNNQLEFKDYEIAIAKTYEADDIIYTYCKNKEKDEKIYIVSSDKDFYSCLKAHVYLLPKLTGRIKGGINEGHVLEEFGFSREIFECYKALVGDRSDNIKAPMNLTMDYILEICKEKSPKLLEKRLAKERPHNLRKYLSNYSLIKKQLVEEILNKEYLQQLEGSV